MMLTPEARIALTAFVGFYLLADALLDRRVSVATLTSVGGFLLLGCWQWWAVGCAVAVFAAAMLALSIQHRMTERTGTSIEAATWIRHRLLNTLLIAVVVFVVYSAGAANPYTWVDELGLLPYYVLVLATGSVVCVSSGSKFMSAAIQPFADQLRRPSGDASVTPTEGFVAGGRTIGRYERLLVFIFIITSSPIALGFLIAAKSIFRFGDLTDATNRRKAEYILLGTLMSVTFAVVVSLVARAVLDWYAPAVASG